MSLAMSDPTSIARINSQSDPLAIATWAESQCTLAFTLKPNGMKQGLLHLINPAMHNALADPADAPFQLIARIPDGYPVAGPVAEQRQYDSNKKECDSQDAAVQVLERSIWTTVDPDMIQVLKHPITNFHHLSLLQVFQYVTTTYGMPSAEDLTALKTYLQNAMAHGASIQTVFTEHDRVYDISVAAKQALSQHDRVRYLVCAVRENPEFSFAVNSFFNTYPTIAAQTYENLRTALLNAARNTSSTAPSRMGLTALRAPSAPRAFGAHEGQNSDILPPTARANASVQRVFNTAHYCWTHGNCGHPGTKCDTRTTTPGFQIAATKQNPMGGATTNWHDVRPRKSLAAKSAKA
jgi:hypothetical protein